jgi:hypothetical protein
MRALSGANIWRGRSSGALRSPQIKDKKLIAQIRDERAAKK